MLETKGVGDETRQWKSDEHVHILYENTDCTRGIDTTRITHPSKAWIITRTTFRHTGLYTCTCADWRAHGHEKTNDSTDTVLQKERAPCPHPSPKKCLLVPLLPRQQRNTHLSNPIEDTFHQQFRRRIAQQHVVIRRLAFPTRCWSFPAF